MPPPHAKVCLSRLPNLQGFNEIPSNVLNKLLFQLMSFSSWRKTTTTTLLYSAACCPCFVLHLMLFPQHWHARRGPGGTSVTFVNACPALGATGDSSARDTGSSHGQGRPHIVGIWNWRLSKKEICPTHGMVTFLRKPTGASFPDTPRWPHVDDTWGAKNLQSTPQRSHAAPFIKRATRPSPPVGPVSFSSASSCDTLGCKLHPADWTQ